MLVWRVVLLCLILGRLTRLPQRFFVELLEHGGSLVWQACLQQ
jgi:hypothetical protein